MSAIFRSIDALARWSAYVAAMLIMGIAVLILAEIFCRAVLNISLSFAWEYSAYFMGTAVFLAAAFMLTGEFNSFADAFFEAMSGYATAGATIFDTSGPAGTSGRRPCATSSAPWTIAPSPPRRAKAWRATRRFPWR